MKRAWNVIKVHGSPRRIAMKPKDSDEPSKRPRPLFCRILRGCTTRKVSAVAQTERKPIVMSIKEKETALFVDERNRMQPNPPTMPPAAKVRLTSCAVEIKGDVLEGKSGTALGIVLASHCAASTLETEDTDVETEDEVVEALGLCKGKGGGMNRIDSVKTR